MNQYKTLIVNSFQREIRSKTFFIFCFFTLVVIGLFNLGLLFVQANLTGVGAILGNKTVLFFYAFVDFWSLFLAIVFGVNAIQSDSENMILPQILSHPVSRKEYLISRILGSWLMVLGYFILSVALAAIIFSISTDETIVTPEIMLAFFPSAAKLLVVVLFSMFVSMRMTKFVSMVTMLFFFIPKKDGVPFGKYKLNILFFEILKKQK